MFKLTNIFRREEQAQEENQNKEIDKCFSDIEGYDNIKVFLSNYFDSEEDLNVMLLGSPATSKTMFLKAVRRKYNDALYFDFSNVTGRGFIRMLIEKQKTQGMFNKNKEVVLLLDEIDKITPRADLDMLLNLLEENEIHYTKGKMDIHIKMNVKVFATANSIDSLSKHFMSRFFVLKLKEYDRTQFVKIAVKIADEYLKVKNNDRREEIAEEIADKMFKLGLHDVRQIRDVMKLYNIYKGKKTVQEVIDFRADYINEEEEE